jgi:hypothetical protein
MKKQKENNTWMWSAGIADPALLRREFDGFDYFVIYFIDE